MLPSGWCEDVKKGTRIDVQIGTWVTVREACRCSDV